MSTYQPITQSVARVVRAELATFVARRPALAWALYGASIVLEQPRLFRAELARARAFAGL